MHTYWQRASMTVALVIALALAACGSTVANATPGATATPTATAEVNATPVQTGTVTIGTVTPGQSPVATPSTGCPDATQTVTWPGPAPKRVTPKDGDQVTLAVGQTLEIALHFGQRWSLIQPPTNGILRLDTPAGYGDSASQSCIWHFTALQAGSTGANFTFASMCTNKACTTPVGLLDINITITA